MTLGFLYTVHFQPCPSRILLKMVTKGFVQVGAQYKRSHCIVGSVEGHIFRTFDHKFVPFVQTKTQVLWISSSLVRQYTVRFAMKDSRPVDPANWTIAM